MATPERLTRKQQQERTRACLLDAARRVFARDGLHKASVEQVAAEAGFTKGAFYANFASKEQLFLELLDDHFAQRAAALNDLLSGTEPPQDRARAGAADFLQFIKGDAEWGRLFFEFAAHAGRDPEFRKELVRRWNWLIDQIADAMGRYMEATGVEPPGDTRRFALMLFTMANGVALQRLVNPGRVDDDLLPDMFELVTIGAFSQTSATP